MTTIRVQYRRQWQDIPYWNQVVDIAVEGATIEEVSAAATPDNMKRLAKVYREMGALGEALLAEALGKPDPRVDDRFSGKVQPTSGPLRTPTAMQTQAARNAQAIAPKPGGQR